MTEPEDREWFRSFAEAARWRFARTYVESYAHEYTLRQWTDPAEFEDAIRCIERWGVVEPFWSYRRKYLYLDDRKYWHMGDPDSEDPAERPGLINRSWVDVSRYEEEARALGYGDAEARALVDRWRMLLARARGEPPDLREAADG